MKQLTPLMLIFLAACGAALSYNKIPEAKETPVETIKDYYRNDIFQREYSKLNAGTHYISEHMDEVLKTLEVSEVDTIPGKDFVLVFYRYSIGVEIAHATEYMKKIEGKYYLYQKYFSSYDDDPFKNGRSEEAKALLKKMGEWTDADKGIWWK